MIQEDYERMILSDSQKRKRLGRKKIYKFGYPSPLIDSSESTVDVILGGDHGAGAFRLLGKLNYLSSKQRKTAKQIEHGSRVFQFGNIKCKKDTRDIVSLLSPVVNDIIKQLNGGMLVGIAGRNKHVIKCVFLPKIATNLQTYVADNTVFLKWNEGSVVQKRTLDGLAVEGTHKIWKIIENCTYFVTGDLAFYATILGRDGTAPSRCPWCDLSSKEWKADPAKEGNLLTYEKLSHYASLIVPPPNNTTTTTTNPLDNTTPTPIPPPPHIVRTHTNPISISTTNTIPTPITAPPRIIRTAHTNNPITTNTTPAPTTHITNRTPIITPTHPIPTHTTITNAPLPPTVITPPRQKPPKPPDLKGVKEAPLWNIDPSRCITPLLHLEIGLFSKSWNTLQLYLDENVELIPLAEQELKKELSTLMAKDERMKQEIEDLTLIKS